MADPAFFETLPAFDRFADVTDPTRYRPAPDDWLACTTDVVGSTRAIAAGRFKAVNLAGASAIAALMNTLPRLRFPFAFGGDGSAALVPGDARPVAERALAATQAFCAEEMDLRLRAAICPLGTVRAAGYDVRVARFAVAPEVAYAYFAGGGLAWVDSEMKAGRFAVPPAPAGTRPDLTGLSCRWAPIAARAGEIVSLVIEPAGGAPAPGYGELVRRLQEILDRLPRGGHPVPEAGPILPMLARGADLEARATRGAASLAAAKGKIVAEQLFGWLLDRLHLRAGRFDPRHYRRTTGLNTDFRKFSDGLRMTIDCDAATRAEIEALLAAARAEGVARYGLVAQDAAVMTCIVPSYVSDDHLHFVDGAGGGYAGAAAMIKREEA